MPTSVRTALASNVHLPHTLALAASCNELALSRDLMQIQYVVVIGDDMLWLDATRVQASWSDESPIDRRNLALCKDEDLTLPSWDALLSKYGAEQRARGRVFVRTEDLEDPPAVA